MDFANVPEKHRAALIKLGSHVAVALNQADTSFVGEDGKPASLLASAYRVTVKVTRMEDKDQDTEDDNAAGVSLAMGMETIQPDVRALLDEMKGESN